VQLSEDSDKKVRRVNALQVLWGRLKEHPLARLGRGLITGVTDDDPGIATYSQATAFCACSGRPAIALLAVAIRNPGRKSGFSCNAIAAHDAASS
jgi:hypothetical protein